MITFESADLSKYDHRHIEAAVGLIPTFLSEDNPSSAKEQLHANYAHGGGWYLAQGFEFDPVSRSLSYPDEPPLKPVAQGRLHDEVILVFPHALVLILQLDGSWEVSRMD